MKKILCLVLAYAVVSVSVCHAQDVDLIGGQTSILLTDSDLAAVGLAIASTTNVEEPSPRGPGWRGFNINSRTDTPATTFVYDLFNLTPTTGTVEHTGTITFTNSLQVGNFSIGFDNLRTSATKSGFFVASTFGTFQDVMFDIEANPSVSSVPGELTVEGGIFVSPELSLALQGNTDLQIQQAGSISINGLSAIPEPTSLAFIGILGIAPLLSRRRR